MNFKASIAVLFVLSLSTKGFASAAPSTSGSWRCYTGVPSGNNDWIGVGDEANIFQLDLDHSIPDQQAFQNGKVKWVPLPENISAAEDEICSINGKHLWEVTYWTNQGQRCPFAVAFVLATANPAFDRPFFINFFDQAADRSMDRDLLVMNNHPTRLEITIHISGNGQYYSCYGFTFIDGRPHFEGRTHGGRKIPITVTK